MTPQEKVLWSRLRRKKLGVKFRRQHGIGPYIVDFYCPERNLVVEVDGSQHLNGDQARHDKARSRYLKGNGLEILRFWNADINTNLEGVILKIQSAVEDTEPPL